MIVTIVQFWQALMEPNFVFSPFRFLCRSQGLQYLKKYKIPQQLGVVYTMYIGILQQSIFHFHLRFCIKSDRHCFVSIVIVTTLFFWSSIFQYILWSVLVNPLLISPIFLYFREMSGFEPRVLPQQAGALPTQPHMISLTYLVRLSPTLCWIRSRIQNKVDLAHLL